MAEVRVLMLQSMMTILTAQYRGGGRAQQCGSERTAGHLSMSKVAHKAAGQTAQSQCKQYDPRAAHMTDARTLHTQSMLVILTAQSGGGQFGTGL